MAETCRVCRKPFSPLPMGEKNGYDLVACKVCGSVMVDPWVTPDQRDVFFGDIQPEITHVPDPQAEITAVRRFLQKAQPNISGRRFLDVGCRNGYAVVAAKELGAKAHGIDQHDFFIRFAQKKYGEALFDHVTAQDYADAGHQADIIFSREAFSDQTDLEGFTAALAKMLAPGGTLIIEELDGNNFNTPRRFTNWPVVYPPINFLYISKKGLTALLARHGLQVERSFFVWRAAMQLTVIKK